MVCTQPATQQPDHPQQASSRFLAFVTRTLFQPTPHLMTECAHLLELCRCLILDQAHRRPMRNPVAPLSPVLYRSPHQHAPCAPPQHPPNASLPSHACPPLHTRRQEDRHHVGLFPALSRATPVPRPALAGSGQGPQRCRPSEAGLEVFFGQGVCQEGQPCIPQVLVVWVGSSGFWYHMEGGAGVTAMHSSCC